jgi:hypothetical protein
MLEAKVGVPQSMAKLAQVVELYLCEDLSSNHSTMLNKKKGKKRK